MELEILLPFPSAETMTESWAFSEAQIDFRHDPEAGARCTISYAAVELRTHLLQMEPDAQICFVSQRHSGKAAIELHADSLTASGDAYALLPQKDGLLIRGAGRVGVLYGVYEFLKMQGWRWLEPGTAGEYAPEPGCGLLWPKNAVHDASASTLGRGFSIEGALKESADLLIWMARNRMNAYGDRPTRARSCGSLELSCAMAVIFLRLFWRRIVRPHPAGRFGTRTRSGTEHLPTDPKAGRPHCRRSSAFLSRN